MASDRQRRAKQQRRRRPGGPGATAPGDADPALAREDGGTEPLDGDRVSTPGAHADAGLEDVVDARGPEGTTPAPDPLKHSSPYVDEAKLAEAGAELEPDSEAPVDPAPDSLDYPEADAGGSSRGERGAADVATRPRRGRAMTFLRHSAEELKRVQWPNRRQTGQGTAVVLGFVVLAGGYLGLMDAIWKPIIEAIL
jgi:preprotein translocase SecE subunit